MPVLEKRRELAVGVIVAWTLPNGRSEGEGWTEGRGMTGVG